MKNPIGADGLFTPAETTAAAAAEAKLSEMAGRDLTAPLTLPSISGLSYPAESDQIRRTAEAYAAGLADFIARTSARFSQMDIDAEAAYKIFFKYHYCKYANAVHQQNAAALRWNLSELILLNQLFGSAGLDTVLAALASAKEAIYDRHIAYIESADSDAAAVIAMAAPMLKKSDILADADRIDAKEASALLNFGDKCSFARCCSSGKFRTAEKIAGEWTVSKKEVLEYKSRRKYRKNS